MTPDQLELIEDAINTLTNYDASDTLEDLTYLIDHARETLEQVMHIQEDEGEKYYVGKFKHIKCDD